MAGLSAAGIGSGLDVNSIVSQLMVFERQPISLLQAQQKLLTNQISAMGRVKSAMDILNTAAKELSNKDNMYAYKGELADSAIAKITTSNQAIAGTYSLEVKQLATQHKIATAVGADPSSGGRLTIEQNGKETTIELGENATLEDMRDAINKSDAGVTATIVNGKDGPQLMMTSTQSGEAGQIKMTGTDGLEAFSFDPADPTANSAMREQVAAQDALLVVDGIAIKSATNTVDNAISGVTLNLTKTNEGNPTQLTVSHDSSVMQGKVEAFVNAYNNANNLMKELTQYDASDKSKSGALNGDTTIRDAQNQLRAAMSNTPSGADAAFSTMSSLGITTQKDGSLKFDASVFQSAIESNPDGVAASLSAYGNTMAKVTENMNQTGGLLDNRTNGLNTVSKNVGTRIDEMENRMVRIEARYRAQYGRLDMIMAQFQQTANYLSAALSGLNNTML